MNAAARELTGKDPKRQQQLAQQALELACSLPDVRRTAESELNLGTALWQQGHYAQAAEHYSAALARFQTLGDLRGQARCVGNLGNIRYAQAQLDQALSHYFEALHLARELEDRNFERRALNNIGSIHEDLGDYPLALQYRLRALQLKGAANDEPGIVSALINLGNVHTRLEQYTEALACYRQAGEMARGLGNRRSEMLSLLNSGSVCVALGHAEQARELLEAALKLAQEQGASPTEVRVRTERMRLEPGDAPSLEADYRAALEVAARTDSPEALATLHHGYAQAQLRAGRPQAAQLALEACLELAQRHRLRTVERDALQELAQACEQTGDLARALEYYRRFHALDRELLGELQQRRAQVLQVQHQVESLRVSAEAERQRNAELQRVNAELEQANAALLAVDRERRELIERLAWQAHHDELTGLPNRHAFWQAFRAAYDRLRAEGRPLSVALVDVDHFKRINDRFSHAVGDRVLQRMAQLLREHCGAENQVSRFGGEEFVLLLPGLALPEASALCERLRQAIEAFAWHELHPGLRVTVSIGVCQQAGTQDPEALLSVADRQLYGAKAAGRNRVCDCLGN
nr:diguanylate cyclase [Deinobacterium chartae]